MMRLEDKHKEHLKEVEATRDVFTALAGLDDAATYRVLAHVGDAYDFSVNTNMLNPSQQIRRKAQ